MRILFVAEYYLANPPLVELSSELAKRKHSVSVVTSFRNFDKRESYKGIDTFEITPLVTIHSVPHSLSFPLSYIHTLVQEREVEIIHALMDYSTNTAAASFVSKVTDIPFVYNVQGMGTRTGRFVVDALAECYDWTIERFISRNAKKLILLSKSLISRTRKLGVPDSKIVVIPSGVDGAHYNPERHEVKRKASQLRDEFGVHNEVVVGFVGRLYPAKGLTYLFSAVKRIQSKHPNITLLVVGDGAQRNELEAMSRKLKVRTIFAGWQRDTVPYYSLMDIFVLPSLFEGLPNVILEAMAMRKAVIATKVGGNPDVLSDGENGFLVPAQNVQRLTLALEKLIADENLRIQMGTINRQKIEEHFLWSKTTDRVEKVYSECIGS